MAALAAPVKAVELKKGATWAETRRLSFPSRWVALENWHVVGAFAVEQGSNFSTDFGPEKSPFDPSASFPNPAGGVLRWQAAPASWADAGQPHDLLIFPLKENAAAYAYAEFTTGKAEKLALVGGSDDTFTLWVNGQKLVSHEVFRASGPEQERAEFTSKKGRNTVLLKVCQGILGWNFYLDLRRPYEQSQGQRLAELSALRAAHPEDEANGWAADLECADILKAQGKMAEARALLEPFTQDLPAESWPGGGPPLLRAGDRLVIVGDSITEQRMYSRIMESYLRACQPGLLASIRQSGWSGQRTEDLLPRLEQDVLAFSPTVLFDCYGANDTLWDKAGPAALKAFDSHTRELAKRLDRAKVRLIVSGTTCAVGPPEWREDKRVGVLRTNAVLREMNAQAAKTAAGLGASFIETFPAMLHAAARGFERHGRKFMLSGDDGVHPEWSGHLVVATARLLGLGMDGELARIELDLKSGEAAVAGAGHEVLAKKKGWARLRSSRYPFCVGKGPDSDHHTLAAGARLAPFHERLNRFMLVVKNAGKGKLRLRWGKLAKTVKAADLEKGVNLTALFEAENPFSQDFARIDAAVAKKQEAESREMHEVLHGPLKGKAKEAAVAAAEAEIARLSKEADDARVPVEHEVKIERIP